jgi:hypothetical protein
VSDDVDLDRLHDLADEVDSTHRLVVGVLDELVTFGEAAQAEEAGP